MADQPVAIDGISNPDLIRVQLLASGMPVHAPLSIVNIVNAPRYNPARFGIFPEDANAAAAINAAMAWIWAKGGGALEFWPEKYYIADTLNFNYSNLQWIGFGASFHSGVNSTSPWDQAKGTRFVWTKGTADKMAVVRPLVNAAGPALVGVGIDNILFDAVGVASHCLEILSTRAGRFTKIGVTDAVTANMHLGVVAAGEISASDPRDTQHNRLDQIFSRSWRAAALGADGVVFDGDTVANTSLNTIGYLEYIHKDGAGLVLKSSDNCCFEHVQGFRIAGGTGRGVSFIGGTTTDNPRNHTFLRSGLGAGAYGVTVNTTAPTNIQFLKYSLANGTPAPTPVQGVDISWVDDNRTQHTEALSTIIRDSVSTKAPANGDLPMEDSAKAFDSGGGLRQYAGYVYRLANVAAGAYAGQIFFRTAVAGTYTNRMVLGAGLTIDATATDKGAGTINVTAGYYINGVPISTLLAGTTTVAPLTFVSGTNLTTPAAGAVEFDGKVFYATSVASSRQVVTTKQIATVQGTAVALTNNITTAQNIFAAANDVLTVAASTTYRFRARLTFNTGATSHTTAFGFGGTATFTACDYTSQATSSAAATLATPQMARWAVATASIVTAASTAVTTDIILEGIIRINGAGTIIPQVTFSAGPTGTCETAIDSYFELEPIGSNTVAAVGNWA